jgi:hypothetical protein
VKRYQRFLRRVTSDRQPTSLAVVEVTGRPAAVPGLPSRRTEELASWSLVRWRTERGAPAHERHVSGQSAEQFWCEMDAALRVGVVTWLWSASAVRDMTLLGLWERLEKGEVYLGDTDYRSAGGERDLQRPDGGGYCVLENPPTVVKLRVRGRAGTLQWCDLRNHGLGDVPGVLPDSKGPWQAALSVRRVVHKLSASGLGSLKATAGSQAWFSFKRKYLRSPILIHNSASALLLERAAYYGGRCECFRLGALPPPVYHLDYRSLYGWVMRDEGVPVRLRHYSGTGGGAIDGYPDAPSGHIAEVTVETDEPAYPARRLASPSGAPVALAPGESLPLNTHATAVYWPVGRFRTALAGPELADAVLLGRVRRVHRWARYDCAPVFGGYAEDFLLLRAEAEQAGLPDLAAWAKRMLVCLPGKLGQVGRRWVDCSPNPAMGPFARWFGEGPGGVPCRYRNTAWHTQREEIDQETEESCPAMAAWITSAGRMRLLEAIRAAGWGETYYVDTDALLASERGCRLLADARLLTQHEPGKLRLLGMHQQAEVKGIKHYALDGKEVCAGVPLGDPDEWPGALTPWDIEPLRAQSRTGRRPEARLRRQVEVRSGPYTHGCVGAGGVVEPWKLWED